MYKDRGGRLAMQPIWDWNLSFGNANYWDGWLTDGWYHDYPDLISSGGYPWFGRLFQDPDFSQRYADRWGELRTNVFNATNILARVDELASVLD